jgi:hypothetical protein
VLRVKAILRPSGEKTGPPSVALSLVTGLVAPPSTLMCMSLRPDSGSYRDKATLVPSGEKAGLASPAGLVVSL